jgi:bacterioferritin
MSQPHLVKPVETGKQETPSQVVKPFLMDIEEIRRRAREHIMQGAVTPSYQGDLNIAIQIMNEALATEIVCTLRYKNHFYMAQGIHSKAVADEFHEHWMEEEEHADWIAQRIRELGGVPDFNPSTLLTRSHAEYQEGETLVDQIKEDLIAERIAIESYREIIRYFDVHDPTSRRLFEKILAKEEEHADDLQSLLVALDTRPGNEAEAAG